MPYVRFRRTTAQFGGMVARSGNAQNASAGGGNNVQPRAAVRERCKLAISKAPPPTKLHAKSERVERVCAVLPFDELAPSLAKHPAVVALRLQPKTVHAVLEQLLAPSQADGSAKAMLPETRHCTECSAVIREDTTNWNEEVVCQACGLCEFRSCTMLYRHDPFRSFTDEFGVKCEKQHWHTNAPSAPECDAHIEHVCGHIGYGSILMSEAKRVLRAKAACRFANLDAAVAAALVAASCPDILRTRSARPQPADATKIAFACRCGKLYSCLRDVRWCRKRCA